LQSIFATGYIDDIGILYWGNSIKEIYDKLEKIMQQAIIWAKKYISVFAPSKFQFIYYTRRHQVTDIDRYI